MTFGDALEIVQRRLVEHYTNGDYTRLGMALQDCESEIVDALSIAAAQERINFVLKQRS